MTAAVFRAGDPVDSPILLQRQYVSAGHCCMQVSGRTLTARPLTSSAGGGTVTRTDLKC